MRLQNNKKLKIEYYCLYFLPGVEMSSNNILWILSESKHFLRAGSIRRSLSSDFGLILTKVGIDLIFVN